MTTNEKLAAALACSPWYVWLPIILTLVGLAILTYATKVLIIVGVPLGLLWAIGAITW